MPLSNKYNKKEKTEPPAIVALKNMNALIEELVKLMELEAVLIEERRMDEHAVLLKQKQRLTMDYRASMKSVALQPDMLKEIPDDLRQKAKKLAQKLAETSERNAITLRAAMTAAQRLIQTIVGIVKDEVLPKGGYVNPNTAVFNLGTYSPTCQPVTVRRTA